MDTWTIALVGVFLVLVLMAIALYICGGTSAVWGIVAIAIAMLIIGLCTYRYGRRLQEVTRTGGLNAHVDRVSPSPITTPPLAPAPATPPCGLAGHTDRRQPTMASNDWAHAFGLNRPPFPGARPTIPNWTRSRNWEYDASLGLLRVDTRKSI
ncbi:MAG TPA: hypothetical protein VM260_22140 [Pirellula sp.]|nr:hypothetical protein [Pirellula sp.]